MTAVAIASTGFAVAADAAGAGEASEWLAQACSAHDVPPEQVYRLDTCLTEALANVISHGGEGALAAPVVLTLCLEEAGNECRAVLEIADCGRPFDPLAHQAAPRPATLDEATPGGLGLTMIRNFSDHQDYAYRDGRNCLTLRFCWPLFRQRARGEATDPRLARPGSSHRRDPGGR